MKTQKYSRAQAMRLIPLLEGIATEIQERRLAIAMLEEMIPSLAAGHRLHAVEVTIRESELRRERIELRRIGRELELLGCSLTLTDPFEIFIPGLDEGFAWRCGETFLRRASIEPFAA
jgi:hypothetical protein